MSQLTFQRDGLTREQMLGWMGLESRWVAQRAVGALVGRAKLMQNDPYVPDAAVTERLQLAQCCRRWYGRG